MSVIGRSPAYHASDRWRPPQPVAACAYYCGVDGTVGITDYGWYEFLLGLSGLDEVNFWTPSAHWGFRGEFGAPFFFKLKARYDNAICGFAYFARYARLPDWLAWEAFDIKNGCATLDAMRDRIGGIRERIDYRAPSPSNEIGCILLAEPMFFAPNAWVQGPRDWPPANLRHKRYNLAAGEGLRIWEECRARTVASHATMLVSRPLPVLEDAPRYGAPQVVQPRLGQGIFRVAVMDAYSRACAVTEEHSLPALEASHIQPYAKNGPHEVSNGILLRADLHRLFDQGYVTITPKYRVEVSPRLKLDYQNGRSYYPLHGSLVSLPAAVDDAPSADYLRWHNEQVYRAT
jgi:putative restriction endonuclease